MKQLPVLLLLLLLTGLLPARADGTDDTYVVIYNTIQEADLLDSNGQANRALAKYVEAQTALQRFQRIYPEWNTKLVGFRLSYVASRIAALSTKASAPAAPSSALPAAAPAKSSAGAPTTAQRSEADGQIDSLRGQVRQLQADKILLEAKLKESLSAQPASLDPREMARAQEKMKSLLKENELLKVDLDQAKTRADPKALLQAQLALAEANRQLAQQNDKSKALETEKAALQTRLTALASNARNAMASDSTRRALDDANRQIAQQKELAARLTSEKETLQQRLNALSANNDATDALRTENQILKKQLADLRTAGASPDKNAEAARQLAQAQAQVATLQSDKELLRMEKLVLENKVRKLSTASATTSTQPEGSSSTIASTVLPSPSRAQDAARIKQLEGERDALQKQLTAANKELYGRKGQAAANRVLETENQLAILRARLEIFEARQVPYSSEELALVQKPETKIVANPNAGKKPISEMPSGSATLVADAQRLFAARQYDRAAEKYTQILHQDEKNVPTLANLAAIEMAGNHLDEAEKHAQQAVALAPDDAYSLGILGQIRFREEKYEEALDALSKAAKLDPDNAAIQNLLGLVLSEKGLRGPAENALRKAIQLQPGYGDAHANLAVVYITQHPPLVELARWHYQKALAAGNKPNAFLEKMLNAPKTADARTSQ